MHRLHIDIETFSTTDIRKSGLYAYAQAPTFQILLLAYAYDDDPVRIIDLALGETIPPELLRDMHDPSFAKLAYNASFEWYCLSLATDLAEQHGLNWLPQWHCSMLHGLYCGYPAGLAASGTALGLDQDKRKLSTGMALIRTFCVPTKPSRANGFRTRTLPHHEPQKWELFKQYCIQDVVTEREIYYKLSAFPVPADVHHQWVVDQTINARGVAADIPLAKAAIQCSVDVADRLTTEAVNLTGLGNPNSAAQLVRWLEAEAGVELPNLQKQTVKDALKGDDLGDEARRMLELRQELSKTSVKKFQAMVDSAGVDGRIRGLLQFYGANRTGRWAGRLVQVQNLPRTYLGALPMARELVKQQRIPDLELIYGSVPDTLSQLIRTALVAPIGKLLVSADFSAIEARVIAWLAGEQWRLDVFATHGRIYEASASAMFGVPLERIVKGNPEYELRQRGKVAELALGYQGGVNALTTMDLNNSLTDDEKPEIVRRWREASPRIKDFWYAVDGASIEAVQSGRPTVTHGIVFAREGSASGLDFLTITLPSGRKLFYAQPHMTVNRWGKPSLGYMGMNQTTKKWGQQETYGGKLVENIVQATARDCLSDNILRLEAAGYPVVFHVHDEVIIEVDEKTAEAELQRICGIMGQPLPWAEGLLLRADGWVSAFYKKD